MKSLPSFFCDIDVNYIVNYRTNYLLYKCRKKVTGNKWDGSSMSILIIKLFGIAINYESQLKIQLIFVDIFADQNLGLPRFIDFQIYQTIYLFMTFIMFWKIFVCAVDFKDPGHISSKFNFVFL